MLKDPPCPDHSTVYVAGCPGCKARRAARYRRLRQVPGRAAKDAARTARYRQEYPERAKASKQTPVSLASNVRASKRNYDENPERREANLRRVKARKLAGLANLVAYWESRGIPLECFYCRGPFEHIDHFHPRKRGGSDDPSNLVPACAPCNLRKHDKLPIDWINQLLKERHAV